MRPFQFLICVIVAIAPWTLSPSTHAAELYWDTNGATAGSGNAGGSWAGNNWSTNATGESATTAWTGGSDAVFSAGTDGAGAWTVDVAAADRSVRNVIVQEGAITLGTSGSFALSDNANWSAAAGSSLTVAQNIANSGHDLSFFSGANNGGAVTVSGAISGSGALSVTGPGVLTLSAENSYGGETIIDGGTLKLGHQFGIGKVVYGPLDEYNQPKYAQAKGFTLRSGTFDINGKGAYFGSWLVLSDITLGGVAGAEMTIIDTGTGGGFGLFAYAYEGKEAKIIYDATNNPGTATIAAPFATSGYPGGTVVRSIIVGDSTATDVEIDFTGTLGQTTDNDGHTTTIRKEGLGTMRISAVNHFPRLHVTGGVLIANHNQALGESRVLSNLLTLQGGTLQAGGADRSFDTPISLIGSGTISGDDWNLTLSGEIKGTGNLVKSGTKTLTLTGDNIYTGTTTISSGTLRVGDGGDHGTLGSGNIVNNGVLAIDRSDEVTLGQTISGTGSLTKSGAGTLTLTATNSYSGETVIDGGTLKLGNKFGIGKAGSHAKGFTLKNGTFDINGYTTYDPTGGPSNWLVLAPITLGGVAGAEMTIIDSQGSGGFGLFQAGKIVYDATNNPGIATISAAFSTSGMGVRLPDPSRWATVPPRRSRSTSEVRWVKSVPRMARKRPSARKGREPCESLPRTTFLSFTLPAAC